MIAWDAIPFNLTTARQLCPTSCQLVADLVKRRLVEPRQAGSLSDILRRIFLFLVALCLPVTAAQAQVRDLADNPVEPLRDAEARAIVFIFVRTDCPISNRYAPEVKRLAQRFAARGIRFRLVYPGADESADGIRRHLDEYEYKAEALRDPQHELVRLTGVRVTPEAAVFAPDKAGFRLVYRGRIDDRYVAFGRMRPAPTRRDLAMALEAISKGRAVKIAETKAIGCFISP